VQKLVNADSFNILSNFVRLRKILSHCGKCWARF